MSHSRTSSNFYIMGTVILKLLYCTCNIFLATIFPLISLICFWIKMHQIQQLHQQKMLYISKPLLHNSYSIALATNIMTSSTEIKVPDRIRVYIHRIFWLMSKWILKRQKKKFVNIFWWNSRKLPTLIEFSKIKIINKCFKTTNSHFAWAKKFYMPLFDPELQLSHSLEKFLQTLQQAF